MEQTHACLALAHQTFELAEASTLNIEERLTAAIVLVEVLKVHVLVTSRYPLAGGWRLKMRPTHTSTRIANRRIVLRIAACAIADRTLSGRLKYSNRALTGTAIAV